MVASAQILDACWSGISGSPARLLRAESPVARYDPAIAWLDRINAKIMSLTDLHDGWNSYGGKRPSREATADALMLAQLAATLDSPEPSVVPSSAGGIQLEWHVEGLDLEVECLSGGRHVAVFENEDSGEEWDAELEYGDLLRLTEALRLLGSKR